MLSLFKMMVQLDLYNTLPGVWMVAMIGPFQILMMRAAFMGIPERSRTPPSSTGRGSCAASGRSSCPRYEAP